LVVPRLLGCRKFACYTVGGVETLWQRIECDVAS
jgi:hypothetical protein